ncbi:hypothetical protein A3715_18535 [Oleiphilus sp. HI0009]|nr:hypothetical protein A3715_18535 [Oleiphilus sp. HI0009]
MEAIDLFAETEFKHLLKSDVQNLEEKVKGACNAVNDYRKGCAALNSITGEYYSSVYAGKVVQTAYSQWIEDVCKRINKTIQFQSQKTLTLNELRNYNAKAGYGAVHRGYEYIESTEKAANELLKNHINYTQIDNDIDSLLKCIDEEGFIEGANELADSFYLRESSFKREYGDGLKTRRNSVELRLSYWGNRYDRQKEWASLKEIAKGFENESGVSGLGYFFESLNNQEERLDYDETLNSREKINEGGKVWAQYFQTGVKIYLEEEVFEALLGFISAYSTHTIAEVTFK